MNQVMAEQLLIIAPLAWVGAAIAGRLGLRPFVGAIVMGILLGPAVLGQFAPQLHRLAFQANTATLEQFHQAMDQRRQTRQALLASGVSAAAVTEFDQQTLATIHRFERRAFEQQQQRSQARQQILIGLGFIWLLVVGAVTGRSMRGGHGLDAIGVGAAVMVISLAAILLALAGLGAWLESGSAEGAVFWRAVVGLVAIGTVTGGCVPFGSRLLRIMPAGDPAALADTRRIGQSLRAGLSIVPWVLLLGVIWVLDGRPKPVIAALSLTILSIGLGGPLARNRLGPIVCSAIGGLGALAWVWVSFQADLPLWFVGTGLGVGLWPIVGRRHGGQSRRQTAATILGHLISPIVCLLLAMKIDPVGDFNWLVFLGVLLLCGDVKWLGIVIGYRLINRSWRAGMAGGTALINAGPMLLLLSFTARQMNLVEAPVHVAVVLAAPILALMQPAFTAMLADCFAPGQGTTGEG